jgi:hypothetical protein
MRYAPEGRLQWVPLLVIGGMLLLALIVQLR